MPLLDPGDGSLVATFCALVSAGAFYDEPQHHQGLWDAAKGTVEVCLAENELLDPSADLPGYTRRAQAVEAMPLRLDLKLARKDGGRRMAGELLLTTLSLHRFAPQCASLAKAIDLIQQRNVSTNRSTSRASIMGAWARYKSVAHILAAGELLEAEMEVVDSALDDGPTSLQEFFGEAESGNTTFDWLEHVLAAVEMMERFTSTVHQIGRDASRAYSHSRKKLGQPLVSLNDLWMLPGEFVPPEIVVEYPPLTKEDRRRLGL